MDKVLKPACKAVNALYHVFLVFASLVLLAIVLIVSAQVFAVQVLNKSIRWSAEVSQLLMVWMAFITCAVGVERNLHIGIEMFYAKFPKFLKVFCFYLNWLLTITVGVFFVIFGWRQTMSTTSSTLPATGWPKCVMYAIIPVSGVFVVYFALIKMFRRDDLLPAPVFFEDKPEPTEGGND